MREKEVLRQIVYQSGFGASLKQRLEESERASHG